jgi:hypothetical protein
MEGCEECKPIKNAFDTIGITYYRLSKDKSVLCYRHWHQAGRPFYNKKGDHDTVFITPARKYEKF